MSAKYFICCLILVQTLQAVCQTPERISYQASIRNADNTVVAETKITVKLSVLQNSFSGASVYEEIHHPTTSSNGIVGLEIGGGNTVKGEFSKIDWSKGPYFIETSVDTKGGNSYTLQGASQLVSVPYALHAKTAERIADGGHYVSKAKPISLEASRKISADDIGNIIECTTDATLTIIDNFADMEIGDVINLEVHNGAILNIETDSQVSLNYMKNGKALFESLPENVRFGLLRKIDVNAYIISGQ